MIYEEKEPQTFTNQEEGTEEPTEEETPEA